MDHLYQTPSTFLDKPERRGRITTALSMLRDAWDAAQDLQCSPLRFAVKREEFRAAGVTDAYLLWLLARGYVVHGSGLGGTGDDSACRGLTISGRSHFVLSKAGMIFAVEWLDAIPGSPLFRRGASGEQTEGTIRPHWDGELRRLWWNGILIKHFRVPAWSQELILATFEEEGWKSRIDDPLPHRGRVEPKSRLHDTIKGLNRHQRNRMLYFAGDGTGSGVVWLLRSSGVPVARGASRAPLECP
jgi:hypothetical protein